jgi:transposase InsO family protein
MSASNETVQEPVKPSPLPKRQWDEISVDFCGPMPSGEYFMVVISDYCRYPVVEKLNSVSAQAVIPLLERIFGLFSIPNVVKTDNGSPFNSHTFSEFADQLGFKHRKITPLHPKANGTAEAFMKPLVKCMKTALASGQNYKSELNKFLMNYRSTPHPSTGVSPFELMFNRKMKTKIPQFPVPPSRSRKYVNERDTKVKQKNKYYADKRNKAKASALRPGDKVLVKQQVRNKLDTPFSPVPGSVVSRKGSMVTVRYKDRILTRDASHLKPVLALPPSHDDIVRQEIAVHQPVQQPLRRSSRERKPPRKYDND